jgi:primosomal protein N'
MDSDTMSGRGAHEKVLDAFGAGKIDVLVGTQMIAKGLDFPNALLVGVLCADSALFLPDYRASERTFQLLAQVTGRTGRGPKGGRVVVQAYDLHHPAIKLGVAQDYTTFARGELKDRKALGYPPFGRLVRVVVQGPDERAVSSRAGELGSMLRAASGHPDAQSGVPEEIDERPEKEPGRVAAGTGPLLFPEAHVPRAAAAQSPSTSRKRKVGADLVIPEKPLDVQILGPAPAPIPRINKQHRVHLVAKCADDQGVEALLTALHGRTQPVRHVRVLVDVDPLSML